MNNNRKLCINMLNKTDLISKIFQTRIGHPSIMRLAAHILREIPPKDCTNILNLPDYDILSNMNSKILVHMTGKNSLVGKTQFEEMKKFVMRNPDNYFVFWDDKSLETFFQTFFVNKNIFSIYSKARSGIVRSDIFRLCVLKIFGGSYFDMKSSFQGQLSLLPFHNGKLTLICEPHVSEVHIKALLPHTHGRQLGNWFMSAPPETPIIDHILEWICEKYSKFDEINVEFGFAEAVWQTTGPKMLTEFFVRNNFPQDIIFIEDCDRVLMPQYSCRGAWVRQVISNHYAAI